MVVVGPEGGVALGTLALSRLVPGAQTAEAEHVEALGEHGVLALHLAGGAGQLLLVLPDLPQGYREGASVGRKGCEKWE